MIKAKKTVAEKLQIKIGHLTAKNPLAQINNNFVIVRGQEILTFSDQEGNYSRFRHYSTKVECLIGNWRRYL